MTLPYDVPVPILPNMHPESSLNDRMRSVTAGALKVIPKAGSVLSGLTQLLWPKSPSEDVWQKAKDGVQELIEAAMVQSQIDEALGEADSIQQVSAKIQRLRDSCRPDQPVDLLVLHEQIVINIQKCSDFLSKADKRTYSYHYMPLTLGVAHYHLALLRETWEIYQLNKDDDGSLERLAPLPGEIAETITRYTAYFTKAMGTWKIWRKSRITTGDFTQDYMKYRRAIDHQSGDSYQVRPGKKSSKELDAYLSRAVERFYNNAVCQLLDKMASVAYLNRYDPETELTGPLRLEHFSHHPQGPFFFNTYWAVSREDHICGKYGVEDYAGRKEMISTLKASTHSLAFQAVYASGATENFLMEPEAAPPKGNDISFERGDGVFPIQLDVYFHMDRVRALCFTFSDGSKDTVGSWSEGPSAIKHHMSCPIPYGFLPCQISTGVGGDPDSKVQILDNGVYYPGWGGSADNIKIRFAIPGTL